MRCLECVGRSWWIWAGMVREQGGMDGLMKGQMMVEWEMDSADRTCDVTQPKNTLF